MTGAEFDGFDSGVDIDLLADYIGGALAGTPDESAVATLIAEDPAWQAAYRGLGAGMTAVGAELGRFAPEPMPADLAARLDTLLTTPAPAVAGPGQIAEPAPIPAELAAPPVPHLALVRDDDAAGDGAHGVREERTPERERGTRARPARRLRWVTPIAIAAGVVAFVGFGLDYLAGRVNSSSDTASTSGLAESQARDNSADGGAPAAAPTDIRILESGTDYTRATLADEPAAQALAAPNSVPSPGTPDSASSAGSKRAPDRASGADEPLSRLRVQSALQACLDAIQAENGGGGQLFAQSVDYARFNGAPAIVVRFTASNGAWAWASGPACGMRAGDADTLSKLPVR